MKKQKKDVCKQDDDEPDDDDDLTIQELWGLLHHQASNMMVKDNEEYEKTEKQLPTQPYLDTVKDSVDSDDDDDPQDTKNTSCISTTNTKKKKAVVSFAGMEGPSPPPDVNLQQLSHQELIAKGKMGQNRERE
jgi:hypothetical protein